MFDGLVTAFRTLAVLPVPGRDARDFSRSLPWFPLVGFVLGIFQAVAAWVGHQAGSDGFGAAMALVTGFVLTRGMHADGLADVADGFWGGRDHPSRLRIMKDPAVGSFGALALISLALLKWTLLVWLIAADAYFLIVAGVVSARYMQVLLAASLPYARSEGGTAGGFVSGAGRKHVGGALMLSFLILALLVFLEPYFLFPATLAFGFSLLATLGMGMLSQRKIGGITGDVLGATSEVSELAFWFAAAWSLGS